MAKYNLDKILVSFSGGKTSGMMLEMIFNDHPDAFAAFANTGQEHPETIAFVQRLQKKYPNRIAIIEPVLNEEKGKGTDYKVVYYPYFGVKYFEQVSKIYGLPSSITPVCTKELKTVPLRNYAKSMGATATAIGIRADEPRRGNDPEFWYPLREMGIGKSDVREYWKNKDYGLSLPSGDPAYGNCLFCFHKSGKALAKVSKDFSPLDFAEIEHKHSKFYQDVLTKEYRQTLFDMRNGKRLLYRINEAAKEMNSQSCMCFG